MPGPFSNQRRRLVTSALAAAAAGLAGLSLPGAVAAQTGLRKNFSGLAGGKRVIVGNVALACLTDRKRQILVGGGFRSLGSASSNFVQTTLAGLTEADFQAAADAAYAATIAGLTAQGFEVLDNAPLVAMLKSKNLIKANGAEYNFQEGNRQSSKAALVGASVYGGFVPMPNWTPAGGGLAGLSMMGNVTTAIEVDTLVKQHASEAGASILGLFLGVSPVRIEASFGSDWRVPDAFGRGGQTRTGTLTTETGLSSHPLVTRMAVYPAGGGSAGEVSLENEIGIQGGVGTLADTTSGAVKGAQALGNVLSLFGGSGRSDSSTNYTLNADPAAYVAGTKALSEDVVKALVGGLA
jgi:hypothetical protein